MSVLLAGDLDGPRSSGEESNLRRGLRGVLPSDPDPLFLRGRRGRVLRGEHTRVSLEPIAFVGDPPAQKTDRDGRNQAPPERQNEIGDQTQHSESEPEDLSFHWTQSSVPETEVDPG